MGGGGTDLPSYYSKFGGFLVSAAIDKHNYIALKSRFENGFRISYSKTEIVDRVEDIKQPIVREALRLLKVKHYLEIVSGFHNVDSSLYVGSFCELSIALTEIHIRLSSGVNEHMGCDSDD